MLWLSKSASLGNKLLVTVGGQHRNSCDNFQDLFFVVSVLLIINLSTCQYLQSSYVHALTKRSLLPAALDAVSAAQASAAAASGSASSDSSSTSAAACKLCP